MIFLNMMYQISLSYWTVITCYRRNGRE